MSICKPESLEVPCAYESIVAPYAANQPPIWLALSVAGDDLTAAHPDHVETFAVVEFIPPRKGCFLDKYGEPRPDAILVGPYGRLSTLSREEGVDGEYVEVRFVRSDASPDHVRDLVASASRTLECRAKKREERKANCVRVV